MTASPIKAAAPPSNGPQLRDIHLPPAPSWWPPAPGWWLLGALVLLVLVAMGWWWRRRRRRALARQRPLREISRLQGDFARDGDCARLASGLHGLLRRLALARDPRAAHQRGKAWRETLARVPVGTDVLARLSVLEDAVYRPDVALDVDALVAAVRQWVQLAVDPRRWQAASEESGDA